jgi:hypothetical protein
MDGTLGMIPVSLHEDSKEGVERDEVNSVGFS